MSEQREAQAHRPAFRRHARTAATVVPSFPYRRQVCEEGSSIIRAVPRRWARSPSYAPSSSGSRPTRAGLIYSHFVFRASLGIRRRGIAASSKTGNVWNTKHCVKHSP